MRLEDLFEELKVIRTIADKNGWTGFYNDYIVEQLDELINEIGQDIGEF